MKRLLTIGLLLFAISPASCLTLTEIRGDARALVNDALSTRQRFSNAQIDLWVNEAQRIADARTLCVNRTHVFDLAAGTTFYDMPLGFMSVKRLNLGHMALQELTPAALDSRSAEWATSSGYPTYYFVNFSSRAKVGFAPFPGVSTDTGTVRLDYSAYSNLLVNDTDVPFDGVYDLYPYHYMLTYYAAFKMSLIDERDGKAKVFMDSFGALTELMKERCIERPNYAPGASGKR